MIIKVKYIVEKNVVIIKFEYKHYYHLIVSLLGFTAIFATTKNIFISSIQFYIELYEQVFSLYEMRQYKLGKCLHFLGASINTDV